MIAGDDDVDGRAQEEIELNHQPLTESAGIREALTSERMIVEETVNTARRLSCGVIGTSRKQDERRVPIHPDHLTRLPEAIRRQLVFETGYGAPFNRSDTWMAKRSGGVESRAHLLANATVAIIAKPVLSDLNEVRNGGIIWGYAHCAQSSQITQAAIDRQLTLIAFEDMFVWGTDGTTGRHTFYKNNELAGYCAVLHALALKGIDGHYGRQRKAIIFGFGAVSRGAIYALKARGFRDITIVIRRPDHEVREEILDCHYVRVRMGRDQEARMVVTQHDGSETPLNELIGEADIIVNGTFQSIEHPINFVLESEVRFLKSGSLIIDVSCDEGMGFSFARPTSFREPIFRVNESDYYAVDHTPSYLWESASRSISGALIVHLAAVLAGPDQWTKSSTIRNAINVQDGVVKKSAVLRFQKRESVYPHHRITSA
jgi:alanine dehydrogenase